MPRHPLRIATAIGAALGLTLTGFAAAAPASASPGLCVGSAPGCFHSVQAAVDAASPGATIHITPGTFAGGIRIAKSLTLIGSGAAKTRLRGGNSVVHVASPAGKTPPTVTMAALTLTGGKAGPDPINPWVSFGGGLLVEGQGEGLGAHVTLRHVVVSGNRVQTTHTAPSPSGAPCPGGDCPFALAAGGGIASFGDLTLDHSIVRNNAATGPVSDAEGGGVWTARGHLRVLHSSISGNRAQPYPTIARYAEGGGVFTAEADAGAPLIPLTISASSITGNTASLRAHWPVHPSPGSDAFVGMSVNGGGLHVGLGYASTVDRTRIDRNQIAAIDPIGEPTAFDSGVIQVGGGTFRMTHSSVSGNRGKVVAATSDDAGPSGTAIEIDGDGTVSDSRICGNTADAVGTKGSAQDSGGLAVLSFDGATGGHTHLYRTVISGNRVTAESSTGLAYVLGVGILNSFLLTLDHTRVVGNHGKATGSNPLAQGGGIWNGAYLSGPPVTLTANSSTITGNSVSAPGGSASGGGVFTTGEDGVTFSISGTTIAGNAPDDVAGPAGPLVASSSKAPASAKAASLHLTFDRPKSRTVN